MARPPTLPRLAVPLAAILLAATALLGLVGCLRAAKDARDIERLVAPVQREVAALAATGHPVATRLRGLGRHPERLRLVAVLLTLVAIGAVSSLALGLHGVGVPWAPTLAATLGAASALASPHYALGPGTPWSARDFALATAIVALAAALVSTLAFLGQRRADASAG